MGKNIRKIIWGFENLNDTIHEDENEVDELANVKADKKTKQGYLKDGFVVDDMDNDDDDDDEEDADDYENIDDIEYEDDNIEENEDDDDDDDITKDIEENDEDDYEDETIEEDDIDNSDEDDEGVNKNEVENPKKW